MSGDMIATILFGGFLLFVMVSMARVLHTVVNAFIETYRVDNHRKMRAARKRERLNDSDLRVWKLD